MKNEQKQLQRIARRISQRNAILGDFERLPDSTILRKAELSALLGVSVPTLWRLARTGALPRIKLSSRCTGWLLRDVRSYLALSEEAA